MALLLSPVSRSILMPQLLCPVGMVVFLAQSLSQLLSVPLNRSESPVSLLTLSFVNLSKRRKVRRIKMSRSGIHSWDIPRERWCILVEDYASWSNMKCEIVNLEVAA
ncbi:hypothetical protein BDV24DRAFT_140568 [Aspergillus arachidicola]|uniref:Uncharacterized protein n=1 Tax=Aspergillus arachidicola TaxID=656916 RepID=A0A5N6XXY7_9EURO|nr:hypothetical protein BDV24DRAFT_140568 [Aspergillus arachidicola]